MSTNNTWDVKASGPLMPKIPFMLIGFIISQFIFWVLDVDFTPENQKWILAPIFIGAGLSLASVLFVKEPTITSTKWLIIFYSISLMLFGWMFVRNYHYQPFIWAFIICFGLILFCIYHVLKTIVVDIHFNINVLQVYRRPILVPWIAIATGLVVIIDNFSTSFEFWNNNKRILGLCIIIGGMIADLVSTSKVTNDTAFVVLLEVMVYSFFVGLTVYFLLDSNCLYSYDLGCWYNNFDLHKHYSFYSGVIATIIYIYAAIINVLSLITRDKQIVN